MTQFEILSRFHGGSLSALLLLVAQPLPLLAGGACLHALPGPLTLQQQQAVRQQHVVCKRRCGTQPGKTASSTSGTSASITAAFSASNSASTSAAVANASRTSSSCSLVPKRFTALDADSATSSVLVGSSVTRRLVCAVFCAF